MEKRAEKALNIDDELNLKSFIFNNPIEFYTNLKYSKNKKEILDKYFYTIFDVDPIIVFKLAYNIEEYRTVCEFILERYDNIFLDSIFLSEILRESEWCRNYIADHLEDIVDKQPSVIYCLVRYFIYANKDILKSIAYHNNFKVRAEFMRIIVEEYKDEQEYKDLIYFYYPDGLSKYFTKIDKNTNKEEIMDEIDVSSIANCLFDYVFDEKLFLEIFKFILEHYEYNHLASLIDKDATSEYDIFHRKSTLEKYATLMFNSSLDYKYTFYKKYKNFIDENVREEFGSWLEQFDRGDTRGLAYKLDSEMGNYVYKFTTEYLEKSTGSKVISLAGSGNFSRAYRVGDYVIKISEEKGFSEECPDNYLIIKNLEYVVKKNNYGLITGCVEVQKYLSKPLEYDQRDLADQFKKALKKLGYEVLDSLLRPNPKNSNLFLLDDYHDANCDDPENLPIEFKENPVVLIDRDYVKKLKP